MPEISFKIVEVVVFRRSSPPEFLVLHRSDHDQIYPGLWQIVSGGIEQGEKAYEAALREIEEEIGMKPRRIFNTPLTNTFYFYTNDSVNISPVFAAEIEPDAEVRLSAEHKGFRWLKKEDAISLLVWPGQKRAIETVCDFILDENPARGFMELPF
ncbi:MAG: NUDIX pyrophosphatase [Bacteroidetes bacterium]|jgi:dATP pyrophosphohydrolase|nr:NUDIX pyrophosphatase [Bacteroidota bacterium]